MPAADRTPGASARAGQGADRTAAGLAVYVHLPWCVVKCPYCDFNSHRAPEVLPERAYVDALLADWRASIGDEDRAITSVFIGGGTPSLFSAAAIGEILAALDDRPGLAPDCEITLEANPGTTEYGRFTDLAGAGVNRISLGVQSFDADCLKALGRIHGPAEAHRAIADVKAAGINALNCDLMFGLPGQDMARGLADVETMIAADPGHISYYQLTFEPGTPFAKRPPARADDDTIIDLYEAAGQRLTAAGYSQYEVSAWGRDHVCRHNLHYWRFGDYRAIGAGAHAKITTRDGQIRREARMRWPTGYMQTAGTPRAITEEHTVSAEDARFEALLNGLRLREGITRADYEARTGLAWADLGAHVAPMLDRSLLAMDDQRLKTSPRGWPLLDAILSELV